MNWTEDEITIVLYEYCRKPFGQFSGTKPFVKELASLLQRTPGAIVRKVGNLASFDPAMKARGVGGLSHTSQLDEVVWNKYNAGSLFLCAGFSSAACGFLSSCGTRARQLLCTGLVAPPLVGS